MDLTIDFASVTRAGDSACGIVITDRRSARTIHETGHDLGTRPAAQTALMAALDQALDAAAPLQPESIELRCASELLVRQITGQSPVDDQANDLFETVTLKLLGVDSWRLVAVEAGEVRAAESLAERALAEAGSVTDLQPDTAAQRQQERYTGIPQWTIEFLDEPGDCPAGCRAGQRFAFGPDTPAGLCVHAAIVALTDGPMIWEEPEQQQMTTLCPHCDTPLRIRRVTSDQSPGPGPGRCDLPE